MKRLLAMIVLSMIGCTDKSAIPDGGLTTGRTKLVEKTMIDGVPFYIISVDGEEFITSYKGGFYPLKKSE